MALLTYIIYQLISYSIVTWAIWTAIAYILARYLGMKGMFFGHFLVAGIILFLDIRWVGSEMSKPGWDGAPDMDIIFHFGVFFRVLLVNIALLIVSFVGLKFRKKKINQNQAVLTTPEAAPPAS